MRLAKLVALIASVVLSADAEGQSFWIGARGGVAMAKQVDDYGPSSTLPGASAGLAAVFEVRTWYGFEVDAFFTQKGWRQGVDWTGLDYLEIPLLLRLAIPRTDIDQGPDLGFQPFIVGGPVQALLMRCQTHYFLDHPNSGSSGGQRRLNDGMHQFGDCRAYGQGHDDFGLTFGGGVTLRRAKHHVTMEVRHTKGFADVRSGPAPTACSRCTITNEVTTVLVGAVLRR
jgi:hypothetical protein